MKPIRIAWCLAAAALVVGCQDQVTDPAAQADELTAPTFKVDRVVEDRYFNWYGSESISWVPCANDGEGESIQWNGILHVLTTKLNTPSGVGTRKNHEVEFMRCDPAAEGCLDYDFFMGLGVDSEDEWTVNSKKSQWNARRTFKGDFNTWHQNYKFALEGANGEKLMVQGTRQEVTDKDGNTVSYHYNNGSCPDVW
jgi:hypothetical protein